MVLGYVFQARETPPVPATRYGFSERHPSSAAGAAFVFRPAQAYTGVGEDRGTVLRRIIGLVLVTLAVSATASAQEVKLPEIEFGRYHALVIGQFSVIPHNVLHSAKERKTWRKQCRNRKPPT